MIKTILLSIFITYVIGITIEYSKIRKTLKETCKSFTTIYAYITAMVTYFKMLHIWTDTKSIEELTKDTEKMTNEIYKAFSENMLVNEVENGK